MSKKAKPRTSVSAKKTTRARVRPDANRTAARAKPAPADVNEEGAPSAAALAAEGVARRRDGKLTDEQKRFVVTALACYDTPSQVQKALKDEYGVEILRQSVEAYNPERASARALAPQWHELFHAARKAFIEENAEIPIARRAVRLRMRARMAAKAEHQGNIALAKELLNDAAREMGGAFTNARVLQGAGKDGGIVVDGFAQLLGMIDGGSRGLAPKG